ncbi:hypothetical protein L798_04270 [Zootermopsis nevadensis]|uniref:Uncharacterized protein n=1 Tax=Zootermopsis nevadensis TaxID=136037 RepID=A0A067RBN3_ZOONE|nr:hypothetical protein L798_04270 [Zootermopsis nevadensis]
MVVSGLRPDVSHGPPVGPRWTPELTCKESFTPRTFRFYDMSETWIEANPISSYYFRSFNFRKINYDAFTLAASRTLNFTVNLCSLVIRKIRCHAHIKPKQTNII